MATDRLAIVFNGYVSAQTGYGAASRAYVHALHHAGVDLSVIDRAGSRGSFTGDPLVKLLLNRKMTPSLYLCHTGPQDIASLKRLFPRLVVLTVWEADKLPSQYVRLLSDVLEIWVPSRQNVELFNRHLNVPIFQLPHPVRRSLPSVSIQKVDERLGLKPNDFVFVSVISWQDRKHPLGVIEAFLRAFGDERDVVLIIKTSFSFTDEHTARSEFTNLACRINCSSTADLHERIRIYGEYWPEEHLNGLMNRANCYVSLHRGEGWCYPLFDAACSGVPVIATGYSGPTDYLESAYHHLVNYRLVPAETTGGFDFSPDMQWADPDIAHAASLMRHVYANRRKTLDQALKGAELLKNRYSSEVVGQMARTRLEELTNRVDRIQQFGGFHPAS
jgi:glycosyltransferase involved in cell wall biosynthesis